MKSTHIRAPVVRVALASACLAAALLPTSAQIPEEITYQGRLSNNMNQPVNGCEDITFRLYDAQGMGATLLWTEAHTAGNCVQVTNGKFSVDLGSITTFDSAGLTFEDKYWLGIQVAPDNEMSPRKPFNSVGYALHAINAEDADHSNMSDNANNAAMANQSNKSNRSDFSVGVKEDKVAMVMTGLRGGDTPQSGSAIYTDVIAAMNDLATWCGTPSSSNRCLLKIHPGEYTVLGSLTMQAYVDVEGSGVDATRLVVSSPVVTDTDSQIRFLTIQQQSGGSAAIQAGAGGAVCDLRIETPNGAPGIHIPASNARVERVSIVGCGGPGIRVESLATPVILNSSISLGDCPSPLPSTGMQFDDADPSVTNVTIDVSSTSDDATGISVENGSAPKLTNLVVTVKASGGAGQATGIFNSGSTTELVGSVLRVTGTTTNGWGVNNDGATVKIDQSVIDADQFSIRNDGGSIAEVGTTKLAAQVQGMNSTFQCILVYDGSYDALQGNCKP